MNISKIKILAIDDDKGIRDVLKIIFDTNGVEDYEIFSDPNKMIEEVMLQNKIYICVVDYFLNSTSINGLILIKEIIKVNRFCWFIMLSGQESKKVIIDFLNNVYGCRYIDKGDPEMSLALMKHVNSISEQIISIEKLYRGGVQIGAALQDLKQHL